MAVYKDSVNNVLLELLAKKMLLRKPVSSLSSLKNLDKRVYLSTGLLNHVLAHLKHKNMAGLRLEAKGRLTKRFTASRSVFKIKWRGSLKNIDSTYRG